MVPTVTSGESADPRHRQARIAQVQFVDVQGGRRVIELKGQNTKSCQSCPFKDGAEFIQWLKDTGRSDMRIISKNHVIIETIVAIIEDKIISRNECTDVSGLFRHWNWFNDDSVIGVKE